MLWFFSIFFLPWWSEDSRVLWCCCFRGDRSLILTLGVFSLVGISASEAQTWSFSGSHSFGTSLSHDICIGHHAIRAGNVSFFQTSKVSKVTLFAPCRLHFLQRIISLFFLHQSDMDSLSDGKAYLFLRSGWCRLEPWGKEKTEGAKNILSILSTLLQVGALSMADGGVCCIDEWTAHVKVILEWTTRRKHENFFISQVPQPSQGWEGCFVWGNSVHATNQVVLLYTETWLSLTAVTAVAAYSKVARRNAFNRVCISKATRIATLCIWLELSVVEQFCENFPQHVSVLLYNTFLLNTNQTLNASTFSLLCWQCEE